MSRCVIFGGGDVLDYEAVAAEMQEGDFIICADSGYRHCEKLGLRPDLLMGDFDSIREMPAGIPVVKYDTAKNYTDSTLAAQCALERGADEILFIGMMGGRLDHSLANLQMLAHCAKSADCHMTDGKTAIYALHASGGLVRKTLAPRPEYYFSLLAHTPVCEDVTICGGKYPLERYRLRFDEARAISNEFVDIEVEISFSQGVLFVVIVPKD